MLGVFKIRTADGQREMLGLSAPFQAAGVAKVAREVSLEGSEKEGAQFAFIPVRGEKGVIAGEAEEKRLGQIFSVLP